MTSNSSSKRSTLPERSRILGTESRCLPRRPFQTADERPLDVQVAYVSDDRKERRRPFLIAAFDVNTERRLGHHPNAYETDVSRWRCGHRAITREFRMTVDLRNPHQPSHAPDKTYLVFTFDVGSSEPKLVGCYDDVMHGERLAARVGAFVSPAEIYATENPSAVLCDVEVEVDLYVIAAAFEPVRIAGKALG